MLHRAFKTSEDLHMKNLAFVSLMLTSGMMSCSEEASSLKPIEDTSIRRLYSADSINHIDLVTLRQFSALAGNHQITALVQNGVETFRIVYNTTLHGKTIQASGLLYVPANLKGPAPLISLQHGTTFRKDEAPSASGQFTGMEYFASAGYIALMPDYIGYGASSQNFHPYYDRESAALTVIDMIHAVKEFLNTKGIAFNDQLFLAGYSEGGYVTLAAAEEIESNPEHNLDVTAVAAGAGGYDLVSMLHSVTSSSYYAYPSYLAFVLMSYNTTYEWNRPLTDFFQDKYAAILPNYMNGNYGGGQINSKLTTKVSSLLAPEFFQQLNDELKEPVLRKALGDNSVSGWKSSIPIHLYHGTGDEIIPYQNSETTLKNFKAAGSQDVSLTLIPGGTHGSSFIRMLEKFVPWFETLRND